MLRTLLLIALGVTAAAARADGLDVDATVTRVKACAPPEAVAALGPIQRADTIGKRSPRELVQLTGRKARGYVVFQADGCHVVPVVGRPGAFVKGSFGHGATVAYALRAAGCTETCATLVSLKGKDDRLIDVLALPVDCEDRVTLHRRALFTGRDSIEVGCWRSAGADPDRTDLLLDTGTGSLVSLVEVTAGVAWYQLDDDGARDGGPRCQARPPGGLQIVAKGARPALDVTTVATPAEAAAARVEHTVGGCESTITTRRFELDTRGTRFVASAKPPRVSIARKLCTCKRR